MSGSRLTGFMFAVVSLVVSAAAALAGGFAGLGETGAGYAAVVPGRALSFPADFGPHPGYRIEWWYVTANLKDREGRAYGVQWTLFRQALAAGEPGQGFASTDTWMGHAAVTSGDSHRFAETFARGGIAQAGVNADPFEASIDDWSLKSLAPGYGAVREAGGVQPGGGDAGLSHLLMTASGTGFSYALVLNSSRPPVLQGDRGYSLKSARGQASYYFSVPSFEIGGSLTLDGKAVDVTGVAWLDREWSSQPLAPDQKGWDWFSLHLSGGAKLMLFALRSESGQPFLAGTWIGPDGVAAPIAAEDLSLEPLERSTASGREVPVRWRIGIKSRGLEIETRALNPASWMGTSVAYWEGPVVVSGSASGVGYLEMTGY